MSIPITSENIYQLIWNVDQAGNGVRPMLSSSTDPRDEDQGYVIVDWPDSDSNQDDHRVLAKAVIPDKGKTYEKCKALFDNYELKEAETETETPEETKEINDFIEAIKDTPPMKIARDYLDPTQDDDQWFDSIKEIWFTFFRSGRNSKNRSGFEHVFVGEQSGGRTNIGGYHFWYKYYIDDGNGKVSGKDTIDYGQSELNRFGKEVPEVVTLNYKWDPNEESAEDNDSLEKPKGGFWVGCSPEGLIALGMARWKQKTEGKTKAVINETRYEVTLYTDVDRRIPENRSRTDDKYINTFWPKFERSNVPAVEVPDIVIPDETSARSSVSLPEGSGPLRIISALANPVGSSPEGETVSLINVSNDSINLNGWTISDAIGMTATFTSVSMYPGQIAQFPTSSAIVLDNDSADEIILKDASGMTIDHVKYSGAEGRKEGRPILF